MSRPLSLTLAGFAALGALVVGAYVHERLHPGAALLASNPTVTRSPPTWCAPCRREIPLLNRIRQEYAANGVEVVGIAVDFANDVRAYASHVPINYPVLVGEQEGLDAARAFGVATAVFPFTAFTDAHGRVVTIQLGELHEPAVRAILGVVRRVDAGTLTPLQARESIRAALAAVPPSPAARDL
jgi:thiol-disulfide isomerase/thioredoxin